MTSPREPIVAPSGVGRFDPSSIAVKLPLAIGALVLVVGATLVTAAYLTMRSASIRMANERLGALTKYFSESYSTATTGQVGQLKLMAANDSISRFLREPTPANRALALAALSSRSTGRGASSALQLRSSEGDVLLSVGPWASRLESAAARVDFPRTGAGDSIAAGQIQIVNDSLVYPLVALISGPEPMGYLVQWRRVSTVPRLGDLMANLLGSEGAMYFANADGSVWTDFASIAGPPARAPAQIRGLVRYTRPAPRGEVFVSAATIPGTPWMWTVEFPARSVLGPSVLFLQRISLIALICVLLALSATWRMSRRLTEPLGRLTVAADAIAAGHPGQRIAMVRHDELGRLGESFDTMAAQVDESRQRLEEKVAERTEVLNRTLQRLQDAQESLVRREKLALLGQLASGVGHELRNPLGVMSNAIYYLQMVLGAAPDDVREYLGIIEQQVVLSSKIVTDLLDLARVTPAQRRPVTLRSITESQLGRLPAVPGVSLVQDFPDSLPLAEVDPVHAGQVVLNLVTNAVQAMGESGGHLTLRGRFDGGNHLSLEVADSGPGVPPHLVEQVFEPLFTTKARGIGLGLAVSRSLAQANGGDVFIAPTQDHGATFVFTMPVVRSAT